jgi:hypothetical protein
LCASGTEPHLALLEMFTCQAVYDNMCPNSVFYPHSLWPLLHGVSISEVDEHGDDMPEISYQRWECLHYGVCSKFRVRVDPLIVVFSLNCC